MAGEHSHRAYAEKVKNPPPVNPRCRNPGGRYGTAKPPVEKACAKCGLDILVRPAMVREYNYCGRDCYHAHRKDRAGTYPPRKDKGIPKGPRIERECLICGVTVLRKLNQAKKYENAYCSREHKDEGMRIARRADRSPLGTTRIANTGYVHERTEDGWMLQHRVVMEQHLGRPLWADENVHHRNGLRADNRISNLELWSKSQPSGQRVEDKVAWAIEMIERYDPGMLRKRRLRAV